ncbi:MAG: hypothetical protein Q8M84_08175, partial [Thiobacillus sp.]|nr:hypothetical protein [Thiobacillus sp.]
MLGFFLRDHNNRVVITNALLYQLSYIGEKQRALYTWNGSGLSRLQPGLKPRHHLVLANQFQ